MNTTLKLLTFIRELGWAQQLKGDTFIHCLKNENNNYAIINMAY